MSARRLVLFALAALAVSSCGGGANNASNAPTAVAAAANSQGASNQDLADEQIRAIEAVTTFFGQINNAIESGDRSILASSYSDPESQSLDDGLWIIDQVAQEVGTADYAGQYTNLEVEQLFEPTMTVIADDDGSMTLRYVLSAGLDNNDIYYVDHVLHSDADRWVTDSIEYEPLGDFADACTDVDVCRPEYIAS